MDDMLQTLGQAQINDDTVGDAFQGYLSAFEEVANLETISGYHDSREGQALYCRYQGRRPVGVRGLVNPHLPALTGDAVRHPSVFSAVKAVGFTAHLRPFQGTKQPTPGCTLRRVRHIAVTFKASEAHRLQGKVLLCAALPIKALWRDAIQVFDATEEPMAYLRRRRTLGGRALGVAQGVGLNQLPETAKLPLDRVPDRALIAHATDGTQATDVVHKGHLGQGVNRERQATDRRLAVPLQGTLFIQPALRRTAVIEQRTATGVAAHLSQQPGASVIETVRPAKGREVRHSQHQLCTTLPAQIDQLQLTAGIEHDPLWRRHAMAFDEAIAVMADEYPDAVRVYIKDIGSTTAVGIAKQYPRGVEMFDGKTRHLHRVRRDRKRCTPEASDARRRQVSARACAGCRSSR